MRHIPVLLNEVIDSLQLKPGMNIIDCTLGDAGHSEAILDKTAPDGRLLGLDADVESVLRAKRNLYRYEDRVTFVHDNFLNLKKVIEETKFAPAQGILMDLGWSSQQFAERGRGFSFNPPAGGDEPLDMRYAAKSQNPNDKSQNELTASEILNTYSEVELAKIFKQYGEEDLSAEIASAVVAYRKNKKIEKTNELTEIILQVYREKLHTDKEVPWVGGIHPATKVYQALRIEVNHELEALRQALPQAVEA
ncbi:MAG: 16S rRNA (cytosine(1402)-N(4))-methyltransferase RsmH, partial [Patescibacteria group bacterium]